jgi:hypothetical protein
MVAGGATALLIVVGLLGFHGMGAARGQAVLERAGYPTPGSAYAGRSAVFGLVTPGPDSGMVRFAPARKDQQGGPETVQPADVGPYQPLSLAPGAEIRVTAPIAEDGVTDWIHGIRVSAQRFAALYQAAVQKYGPMVDRGHMFELWFDDQGRITRLVHYFSP